jgi:hypothetical protein
MGFTFDDVNRIITIDPEVEVTCQEILNACREFEDNWNGMDDAQIAEASGKQNLGGGKQVGITLELLNDWRIKFAAKGTPTFCSVKDGNFVPSYQSGYMPIEYSANVFAIVELDTSAAIVTAAGVGEDWSAAERAQLRDALGIDGSKVTATGGQLQTLALGIDRILGLVHENHLIKDQTYTTIGGRYHLTAATIRIFASAADCNLDQNHIAEYSLTASYDGNGNCNEYKVVKA